jgi:hypothetical protein
MEDFSLNEGFIWFDGKLVDWKETKIHVLNAWTTLCFFCI